MELARAADVGISDLIAEYVEDPRVAAQAKMLARAVEELSNPCFGLWSLLHHQDCTAPLRDAKAVLCQLTWQVPGYQKNSLRFAGFEAGVSKALLRAQRLDPTGCDLWA